MVRAVNMSSVEFPLTAWVEPDLISSHESDLEGVLDGQRGGLVDFISNHNGRWRIERDGATTIT